MSQERHDEFRKTIVINRNLFGELASPEDLSSVDKYIEFINQTVFGAEDYQWEESTHAATGVVDRSLNRWQSHHRFCTTENGRLGWFPRATMVGDIVCILDGGQVPYVIRPRDGFNQWIGECFVQGLMEGEAMPVKSQKISFM
jgi:hypothetical protein